MEETQSIFTGPALSFERLEIIYGEDKAIIVSPADETQFIQKLEQEELTCDVMSSNKKGVEKISKKAKK